MPASEDDHVNKDTPTMSDAQSSSSSMAEPEAPATSPPKGHFPSFPFMSHDEVKVFAKNYRTEIAAASSSVLSTFISFPLDLAKSRMQSYDTTFSATMKDVYKAEGLRSMWRGVGPPLISITVVRTISFSIYQRAKYAYDRSITKMTGQSPLAHANAPGSYPSFGTIACFSAAGATAGVIVTTISCPFELTKLNEQLAGKEERREKAAHARGETAPSQGKAGSWATAKRLVHDRGLVGLYSGYRLHLLRDTIGTAVYFTTYETAKQLMANARGRSPTSPYAVVFAGGLCGVVSWVCVYPVDVAKTMYQKALLSARSGYAARPPIRFFEYGSYRGLTVSVLRSSLTHAFFFSGFEMIKKRINALEV